MACGALRPPTGLTVPTMKTTHTLLTIAIPTFDRPGPLADTVRRLLPQLGAGERLLVMDNCSPQPAADTLREVLAAHPEAPAEVRRHRTNVGGNEANTSNETYGNH